jgi:hypothetical protein
MIVRDPGPERTSDVRWMVISDPIPRPTMAKDDSFLRLDNGKLSHWLKV